TCGRIFWGLRTDGTWGQKTGGTPGCIPPPFWPVPLTKTGQTTSYAAGDDGALKSGVVWPTPRFTDNGNGTITDNLTMLVWMKNAFCFGGMNWASALAKVAGLNARTENCTGYMTGTHVDWRLPNREELLSLIDYRQSSLALPSEHKFLSVLSKGSLYDCYYWSSTSLTDKEAWGVSFTDGRVRNFLKTEEPPIYGGYYITVWPVRGGQ
ncbi:MAG: DUF1566 domain-containing protein, partial [Magnetococcales bacterium]|nr:DUF1566 domain-containing protein [Magnetococcales bacterium]